MRRRVLLGLGVLAGAIVLLLALAVTPPGTRWLVRRALPMVNDRLDGTLRVGGVSGSILGHLTFTDVELLARDGTRLVSATRVEAGYRLGDLLRGDILLDPLRVDSLFVRLVPDPSGEGYTLASIAGGSDTTVASAAAKPRVALRNVSITGGTVVVHDSAHNALATNGDPHGGAMVVDSIDAEIPVAILSSPDPQAPIEVEVASARAAVNEPPVGLRSLQGTLALHGDTIRLSGVRVATRASEAAVDGWFVPDSSSGVRAADLTLERVRVASGEFTWLSDSIPPGLLVTGNAVLRGAARDLAVRLDATLTDSSGTDVALVQAEGTVATDSADLVRFTDVAIAALRADLDAARRAGLPIEVPGSIAISGQVQGSAYAPRLDGRITYDDARGRVTTVRGVVGGRYGHHPLAVTAHLALDSLYLDQVAELAQAPPAAGLQGALGGRIDAEGPLDSLPFAVRLGGPAGTLAATGTLGWRRDSLVADSVHLVIDSLDASRLSRGAPVTRVSAVVRASEVRVAGGRGSGRLTIDVARSLVDTLVLDTAHVAMFATRDQLAIDTILATGLGGRVAGAGQVALAAGTSHDLRAILELDSLGVIAAFLPDSMEAASAVHGTVRAAVAVSGEAGAAVVQGTARSDSSGMAGVEVRGLEATGSWQQADSAATAFVVANEVLVAERRLTDVRATVRGADSLWNWSLQLALDGQGVSRGGGQVHRDSIGILTTLDSLRLEVGGGTWLAEPGGVVAITDPRAATDLVLRRDDGPARVTVAGRLPAADSGHLEVVVDSLPLVDLLRATGDSTSEVEGTVSARGTVSGRAAAARYALSATLAGARIDTVTLPSVSIEATSAGGLVQGTADVVHEGRRLVRAEGRTPVTLGFPPALPADSAPVTISLSLDSIPGSLVDRFVPEVRNVAGALTGHVDVAGTLGSPRLSGAMALRGGAVTLPLMGTRYHSMEGAFRFAGDSVIIDSLRVLDEGKGVLRATGSVSLAELSNPRLNVDVRAANFIAMDEADYEDIMGSGTISLRGPLRAMTLSGRVDLSTGVIRVGDVTRRDVIDLSNPIFASFVDTTALREAGTGETFGDLLLDSLRINTLDVRLGNDVWIRSAEANIQLGGQVTVNKVGEEYPVTGQVLAVRGTYILAMGPGLQREFSVTSGAIRFFTTDTLDAVLDINARHLLRTVRGEMMTVYVHIGGTLGTPTITLSSDRSPALPQTEVISYLMFGAPSVQVFVGARGREQRSFFEAGAEQFTALLAGRLEGAFAGAVDYFAITPVDPSQGYSETEILVGKQLNVFGSPSFLTVSPRVCAGQWLAGLRRVGFGIETWMTRHWLLDASIDPRAGCATPATSELAYQLGIDLFWVKR